MTLVQQEDLLEEPQTPDPPPTNSFLPPVPTSCFSVKWPQIFQ